jgi:hypothetical protein
VFFLNFLGVYNMKKFFAYFAAMLIVASTAFAVSNNALDNVGPWSPGNAPSNYPLQHDNDYSFDISRGEYKIFVICELTVVNTCGNIYLGWLNPDGSRVLGEEFAMTFEVQGGNGWKFQASGYFGDGTNDVYVSGMREKSFYDNVGLPKVDNNVFITGNQWYYKPTNSTGTYTAVDAGNIFPAAAFDLSGEMYKFNGTDGGKPLPGDTYGNGQGENFDISKTTTWANNGTIMGMWKTENSTCCRYLSNACEGFGTFKLVPGTVWAAPDAFEGFYTFPVYIQVDYMTFDNGNVIKNTPALDYSGPYSFQSNVTP